MTSQQYDHDYMVAEPALTPAPLRILLAANLGFLGGMLVIINELVGMVFLLVIFFLWAGFHWRRNRRERFRRLITLPRTSARTCACGHDWMDHFPDKEDDRPSDPCHHFGLRGRKDFECGCVRFTPAVYEPEDVG